MKPYKIDLEIYLDNRGYFCETFKGVDDFNPVQENESLSKYATIRGLHFQSGEFAQAKLIRVVYGVIKDVAIHLHTLEKFEFILNNTEHLFIPKGYAHGFSVLSKMAIVQYKTDNHYNPESEGGLHPFDPKLNIDWSVHDDDVIISSKDIDWPML